MEYNTIDVDAEVEAMVAAVERGGTRRATTQESMAVRLAALSEIVQEMQHIVQTDAHLAENRESRAWNQDGQRAAPAGSLVKAQ
ncbi:MAG: hypothetical protein LBT16_03260 [Treponema sp.]|jgi:hypothetical protein|nr:hypothetical protein [Treponema sp.]